MSIPTTACRTHLCRRAPRRARLYAPLLSRRHQRSRRRARQRNLRKICILPNVAALPTRNPLRHPPCPPRLPTLPAAHRTRDRPPRHPPRTAFRFWTCPSTRARHQATMSATTLQSYGIPTSPSETRSWQVLVAAELNRAHAATQHRTYWRNASRRASCPGPKPDYICCAHSISCTGRRTRPLPKQPWHAAGAFLLTSFATTPHQAHPPRQQRNQTLSFVVGTTGSNRHKRRHPRENPIPTRQEQDINPPPTKPSRRI